LCWFCPDEEEDKTSANFDASGRDETTEISLNTVKHILAKPATPDLLGAVIRAHELD
jgi:hypothetical protein